MSQTDLAARLENMATTREWIAQQRLQEAHVSECEGLSTIAKIERQLSQEHAKVAADLRAAAAAVRLVGECKDVIEMARQQFGSHAGEGQREEECEQLLASIAEWEGKYGKA